MKNIIEYILIPIATIFAYFVTKYLEFSLFTSIFVTIFVFILLQIECDEHYKNLNKNNYDI